MSIRTTKVALRGIFVALVGLSLLTATGVEAAQIENTSPTRMATFEDAGETSFALSIGPESQVRQRASDVIVFVDTSASQTGAYKRDSIEMLRGFVRNLSGDDRISIYAVDLESVPLFRGFVNPLDDKVQVSIENLVNRVALGSTDMESMIETAIKSFESDDSRNRNVIYIGDGISRAGILHTDSFTKAVTQLAEKQISVSSFAIGPERNIALLAALANNSGGNIVIDTDATNSVSNGSVALAETVHGSVFWPETAKLPEHLVEVYPGKCPPMRTDRDTILVGSISDRSALNMELTGMMDGQKVTKTWSIQPESVSTEFSFLPKMLKEVRKDGGVSLPTVGSAGLVEYARMVDENAVDLELLGGNLKSSGTAAIASAAPKAESRVALAARYRLQEEIQEEGNPFGDPFGENADPIIEAPSEDIPSIEMEMKKDDSMEMKKMDDSSMEMKKMDDSLMELKMDDSVMEVAPNQQQPGSLIDETVDSIPVPDDISAPIVLGPAQGDSDITRLLLEAERRDFREQVLTVEQRDRIINEKLRKQVQYETERASQEVSTDPTAAIERLKNMLEVVDQTPQLTQGTVSELRHRLESSLVSATGRKLDFDQNQRLASQNNATVDSLRAEILNYELNEEKLARLLGQYNSLMQEGNYEVAERVADSVFEAFPDSPEAVAVTERARIARTHFELVEIRREKERLFTSAVREIYKSGYPIPGNPPLVFPDAEEWIEKKANRAKYQNVRLAGGENERHILNQLDTRVDLVYDAEPFGDVKAELEENLTINIVIDPNLEGVLDEDTEVSANLAGITLSKGLRTMLKAVDATYVVKDEVLLIISIDDEGENEYLVTDVYNVGDLVAPRSSPTAFGGGQGGFGGGGQGGGLGGGAQGGGFGGGGQGGGFGGGGRQGGGGIFCIQDADVSFSISEETPAEPMKRDAVSFKPGNLIELAPAADPNAAWDTYFKSNKPDSKAVRATVRYMVSQQRHDEIVALINGAIRNNQGDSAWMFQALGLSMQILGRPNSEIERAIMSAVDLSDDLQDAMIAAIYMSRNGMVDRSLRVLEDLAKTSPSLVQPYEIGLAIAERNDHVDGMRWTSVGVLSQDWPENPELAKRARYAAAAVKTELRKSGNAEELVAFENELQNAKHRDCFIDVSWTGDADIDIYIEEPGGTICSRLNPRTTAGGVYYGDVYSGGKSASGLMKEQYVLPKGFSGDYRLIIRRMMGEVTSGKVNVGIHNHFQSAGEASLEKAVKLDSKGAIVLFKLQNGRRTDDLDQHTLETLVRKKTAIRQTAMAQRMAQFISPSGFAFQTDGAGGVGGGNAGGSSDDFFPGAGGNNGGQNNQFSTFSPSVVGYAPQITQLQTGTSLQVNHATTADRLYVLISATPNLTTITEVTTFNITGNAANATGAGGGGTGGAGGGGGFGGGVGGGGGGNF